MGTYETALELTATVPSDEGGSQSPEAGRNAVVRLDVAREAFDDLPACAHCSSCRVIDDDRNLVSSNRHHLLGRERSDADDDLSGDRGMLHATIRLPEAGTTPQR